MATIDIQELAENICNELADESIITYDKHVVERVERIIEGYLAIIEDENEPL